MWKICLILPHVLIIIFPYSPYLFPILVINVICAQGELPQKHFLLQVVQNFKGDSLQIFNEERTEALSEILSHLTLTPITLSDFIEPQPNKSTTSKSLFQKRFTIEKHKRNVFILSLIHISEPT